MTTSIGPLANPDYYLRMQRSRQAANGYYTGGGEPDGIWWNPAGLLVRCDRNKAYKYTS